eukprot:EG_transcript_32315
MPKGSSKIILQKKPKNCNNGFLHASARLDLMPMQCKENNALTHPLANSANNLRAIHNGPPTPHSYVRDGPMPGHSVGQHMCPTIKEAFESTICFTEYPALPCKAAGN